MSFILDALRKSEIERQRRSGPSMAEFPVAREDSRLPVALAAIGVLLALNVAVVLYFMLRDKAPAAAAPPPAEAVSAPAPRMPPQAIAAAGPAATAPAGAQGPLGSEVEPADAIADEPTETYGSPSTLPPDAPDPTLLPQLQAPHPGVIYGEAPAGEDAAAVEAATGLPPLAVDLHIYSDDPAKRAVFINGRRYVQGDQIAEGPVVEQITRDGALLSYRGRRFQLPRL
jgi:general secretion pathway protein B